MVYFLKLHMCVHLRTKFQVSSTILTSFRQGVNFTPPSPQNEPLKSPPRLELNYVLMICSGNQLPSFYMIGILIIYQK